MILKKAVKSELLARRSNMDVNKHVRLSNITLKQKSSKWTALLLLLYIPATVGSSIMSKTSIYTLRWVWNSQQMSSTFYYLLLPINVICKYVHCILKRYNRLAYNIDNL